MSLLPGQIQPEAVPIGRLNYGPDGQPDGTVTIDHNWWLLFYNMAMRSIGNASTGPIAPDTILGNNTAFTQVPTALTVAQVKALLNYVLASADFANQGTTGTVLHGNASGNPSFGQVDLSDIVDLPALTFVGNNVGGLAPPIALTTAQAKTLLNYVLASPDFANQGTATTVLHGNAAGNPSFGAVSLANDVTDTLAASGYVVMVGDSGSGGTQGAVPAPGAGDAAAGKFLRADGTWAITASVGSVIGYASTSSAATDSTSSIIPQDNTIPQSSEGKEFTPLATTYTPLFSTSLLEVEVYFPLLSTGLASGTSEVIAIFRDSGTDAILSGDVRVVSSFASSASFRVIVAATSTSATTFKVRFGTAAAGTVYINTDNSSARYGGTALATMTVKEIKQ